MYLKDFGCLGHVGSSETGGKVRPLKNGNRSGVVLRWGRVEKPSGFGSIVVLCLDGEGRLHEDVS